MALAHDLNGVFCIITVMRLRSFHNILTYMINFGHKHIYVLLGCRDSLETLHVYGRIWTFWKLLFLVVFIIEGLRSMLQPIRSTGKIQIIL